MPSYPSPVRRTPEPPGRVVATLYPLDEDASDDVSAVSEPRSSSFRSNAPVDARVYDEWTAEAEAEARDALAARPLPDEGSLEPRADAPPTDAPQRTTNPAAVALVAVLGVTGAGLLVAGAAAAAAAVAAGIFGAF